jgi:hypothetical protein
VPGELGRRDRAGGGQLVGRPGDELDRLVQDPGRLDAFGELPGGDGDGAEGRVDRAGPDSGYGRVGVEEGHHIEFGIGVRAMEVAQQGGRCEPSADHVDAQRAAAGTHRADGPVRDLEEIAGVGQERLPVDGELGAAGGAGEQPYPEVLLQHRDALGDGLLGERQTDGCFLELARVGGGDKGAHGIEIHAASP